MYGEGVKGADFYISANTFEQCQNAAIPIALTIENSPDLRPGTRIYKGKEDTIRSVKYTFVEDGIKYANTLKVLTKDNAGNEGKIPISIISMKSMHKWIANNMITCDLLKLPRMNL